MQDRTVLIVDDEAPIALILEARFASAGFRVLLARDGEEARVVAREHRPDVVITDYQMPGLDGLGLIEALRGDEVTAHAPVIMLTARGHLISADRLEQLNIRALVPKPFSARKLLRTVMAGLETGDFQADAA